MKRHLPNFRNRFDRVFARIVYLRGDSGFDSGSGFTLPRYTTDRFVKPPNSHAIFQTQSFTFHGTDMRYADSPMFRVLNVTYPCTYVRDPRWTWTELSPPLLWEFRQGGDTRNVLLPVGEIFSLSGFTTRLYPDMEFRVASFSRRETVSRWKSDRLKISIPTRFE